MKRSLFKFLLCSSLVMVILASVIACSGTASSTTPPKTSAPPPSTSATPAPATSAPASSAAGVKPIELSFATTSPDVSDIGKHFQRWADKIKADSGGRLTVRIYPNNTLVSGPDMRKGIKEGAADIGDSAIYVVDPEFQVEVNLPQLILAKDTPTADKIYTALYNKYPDIFNNEWKSYKFLWLVPTLPTF